MENINETKPGLNLSPDEWEDIAKYVINRIRENCEKDEKFEKLLSDIFSGSLNDFKELNFYVTWNALKLSGYFQGEYPLLFPRHLRTEDLNPVDFSGDMHEDIVESLAIMQRNRLLDSFHNDAPGLLYPPESVEFKLGKSYLQKGSRKQFNSYFNYLVKISTYNIYEKKYNFYSI